MGPAPGAMQWGAILPPPIRGAKLPLGSTRWLRARLAHHQQLVVPVRAQAPASGLAGSGSGGSGGSVGNPSAGSGNTATSAQQGQPSPGLMAGGQQGSRTAVSARIEALKSTEASVELCSTQGGSAAVCELDKVLKRRARRQSLVSKLKQRRMEAGSITWGVRSAVSVCLSAMLVLDGKLVRYISQGYGIWAIITCINCNEKFQGDLLRKSFERALGTIVGGSAAMGVLYIDDFFVPEMLGWHARAEFYLTDVALFTAIGVYLRSQNTSTPAWDYSYFLAVLSFDFLLLDSFHDANQYQDSIARIAMVTLGGAITCAVGLVMFPQYAGQELMALSADALEGTASLLEVTASALVMSYGAQAYGAGACPAPIDMGQIRRMSDAARYELCMFPADGKGHGPGERLFPRLSAKMDWFRYLHACRTAQEVRELCQSAAMFFQAGASDIEAMPYLSTTYEVELVVMVEEAASVLRFCSDTLRRGRKTAARGRGLSALRPFRRTRDMRNSFEERMERFQHARKALHGRLDECLLPSPPQTCSHFSSLVSLQLAAVRLIATKLEDKLAACVLAMEEIEAAGLLEAPMAFPIVVKG